MYVEVTGWYTLSCICLEILELIQKVEGVDLSFFFISTRQLTEKALISKQGSDSLEMTNMKKCYVRKGSPYNGIHFTTNLFDSICNLQ